MALVFQYSLANLVGLPKTGVRIRVICRVASQRAALPAFPESPLRTERATLTALRSPVSVNSVSSHRTSTLDYLHVFLSL